MMGVCIKSAHYPGCSGLLFTVCSVEWVIASGDGLVDGRQRVDGEMRWKKKHHASGLVHGCQNTVVSRCIDKYLLKLVASLPYGSVFVLLRCGC